jgi:hypothetical protein
VPKRTAGHRADVSGWLSDEETGFRRNYMLFTVVVVMLIVIVKIPAMRVPRRLNAASLGWMSQQWLAEYRASHPGK